MIDIEISSSTTREVASQIEEALNGLEYDQVEVNAFGGTAAVLWLVSAIISAGEIAKAINALIELIDRWKSSEERDQATITIKMDGTVIITGKPSDDLVQKILELQRKKVIV